jgi:hypothetical protein
VISVPLLAPASFTPISGTADLRATFRRPEALAIRKAATIAATAGSSVAWRKIFSLFFAVALSRWLAIVASALSGSCG